MSETEHPSIPSSMEYEREPVAPLKHSNDYVKTTKPSSRSDNVKDVALDDVIAERKIAAPVKKDKSKNLVFAQDDELGLDDLVKKRRQIGLRSADAMTKSLDEIIQDGKPGTKRRHQDEDEDFGSIVDDDPNRFVLAPLDAIEEITKDGLMIEFEVGKQTDTSLGRSHNWRAKYTCGKVFAICDAPLKKLAKQAAAKELIGKLTQIDPSRNYPQCKIPEACFYDPTVESKLVTVVQNMGMSEPRYETIMTKNCNRDFFTTTYFIGEDEFVGQAYRDGYSKILAAKAAYETYAQKKFPRERFYSGEECIKDKEYVCQETEATHVMTVKTPIVPVMDRSGEDEDPELGMTMADFHDRTEDEELLVDDDGRMYARSDGTNKIRRLNAVNIGAIVEQKLLGIIADVSSITEVPEVVGFNGDVMDDEDENEEM